MERIQWQDGSEASFGELSEDHDDPGFQFQVPWHWRLRVWVYNDLNRLKIPGRYLRRAAGPGNP